MLGSLRGTAQTISYEVRIALIILRMVFTVGRYELFRFRIVQSEVLLLLVGGLVYVLLYVSFVAETNRSPFDFAEGESELVSGFNVEYGRGGFAILFLAEYGVIIFIGFMLIFLGVNTFFFLIVFLGVAFSFLFI